MARNIIGSTREASQGNLYHYYLPKGIINLEITHGPQGFELELEEPSVDLVPDPDHNYFLKYAPNAFTHDEIHVEFSPQGFLKYIKTSIDDQTDEFLAKLAELAASVAQVAVPVPKTRSVDTQIIHSGPLDPFDEEEMAVLNARLKNADKSASFSIKEIGSVEALKNDGQNTEGGFGIYYRPMSTFSIDLSNKAGNIRALMRLPHPHNVHFIEIPIANWVKTDFEIKFDEGGYPHSIHVNKPSSAMAMIQLPINIISAILKLPGELFKFRIDMSSARQEAIAKEQALQERMNLLQQSQGQAGLGMQRSRGIFDWFKRKSNNVQVPNTSTAAHAPVAIPNDIDDRLKKIEQDLKVVRNRVHDMEEQNG